jgi:O-antigen/teichoic acid export membrane protein
VAGRPLLTILYRPEYAEHVDLLFLLMVVAAISYISSLLGAGITASRHFRPAVPLLAFVTIITAVSCFFLIPAYGLRGAALAGILAAAVQAVGCWGILHYVLRGVK